MAHKWVRRAASIGIITLGTIFGIFLFPVVIITLFLVDLWRDRRFPLLRAYTLIVFYGVWELFGILLAFLIWPFKNHGRYLDWNYGLQRLWVRGFVGMGRRLFSMRLQLDEQGYHFNNAPILLLVRHTSLADTILASYVMCADKCFRLRFVMKRELLWDPCLDIVGNRLPNYFVDRNATDTHEQAVRVAALADNLGPHEGVILWPEATRFSESKRDRALKRLAAAGDERLLAMATQFRFVLPPKLMGIMGLLERNPDMDVVFFAHTGFEHAASFRDIFGGTMIGREVRVKIWGYPATQVPQDRNEQKLWLYENWRHMDDFVAEAQTGIA